MNTNTNAQRVHVGGTVRLGGVTYTVAGDECGRYSRALHLRAPGGRVHTLHVSTFTPPKILIPGTATWVRLDGEYVSEIVRWHAVARAA